MAITFADVAIWDRLRECGQLPIEPSILEIGQANWYADCEYSRLPEKLADTIERLVLDGKSFEAAHAFYRAFLNPRQTKAVDLHGGPDAIARDLNEPLEWTANLFDIVINTGTAEHVFDIAQVFRTIHDATVQGGLMVHTFPFRGWLDHGFWSINPTLLHDLAGANGYKLLACAYYEMSHKLVWLDDPSTQLRNLLIENQLRPDGTLHVAWRKTSTSAFVKPIQGHYRESKRLGHWTTFAPAAAGA